MNLYYQNLVQSLLTAMPQMVANASPVNLVSNAIYEAATDGSN